MQVNLTRPVWRGNKRRKKNWRRKKQEDEKEVGEEQNYCNFRIKFTHYWENLRSTNSIKRREKSDGVWVVFWWGQGGPPWTSSPLTRGSARAAPTDLCYGHQISFCFFLTKLKDYNAYKHHLDKTWNALCLFERQYWMEFVSFFKLILTKSTNLKKIV